MEKLNEYAQKISFKIVELFKEEGDLQIDIKELMEGENMNLFIHALANIAPSFIFAQITGEDKNALEFNHIANKLIFQYAKKEK
jgi:hypothetical protein